MRQYNSYTSIGDIQTKLYQRENQFNNFREITDEQYAKIIKIRDSIKRAFDETKPSSKNTSQMGIEKLNNYIAFIKYVTNPQIHKTLPTFDERVLLVILGTDPELQTFYKFLTAPTYEEEIKEGKVKRKQKFIDENMYSQEVRDEIGFYDSKLRFFEEAYFKKYVSKNHLVKESKRSKMNQLMDRASKVESFDKITDIRFEELSAMAEQYRLELKDVDYQTTSYHVGVQYDYFRLRTISEQELMLVLLIDPNMEMLKIFEEESQIKNIAKRCTEAFGFYNPSFIELEKKYKQRFYPELKLSDWNYTY